MLVLLQDNNTMCFASARKHFSLMSAAGHERLQDDTAENKHRRVKTKYGPLADLARVCAMCLNLHSVKSSPIVRASFTNASSFM